MTNSKTYDLTYASIDQLCTDVENYLNETKVKRKEAIRLRLLAEETLLRYRDFAGEDIRVEVSFSKSLGKSLINMDIFCDSMDPYVVDNNELIQSLANTNFNSDHSWRFVKSALGKFINVEQRNHITLSAIRESAISNPVLILICLGAGALLGILCRVLLAPEIVIDLAENYVLPIANAYTGLLGVMAILLIFFSIPLCMVQYGNASLFQKDLKHLLQKFIIVSLIFVLCVLAAAMISFSFNGEITYISSIFKPILDVILSFVPSNIINPFLSFNCMQVLIIGALFGVAFLIMGPESKGMVRAFDKCNLVAVITNGYLAKFVGIYTGLMMFYFVATNDGTTKTMAWIVLVTILIAIIGMLLIAILVSVRLKVKLSVLLKKLLPAFLINLSSANISASFMILFDELASDCGVEVNYNGVSCNLGTVLFKPIYSVFFAATCFLIGGVTGTLSVTMAVQIIILSLVLPAAIPNVPGGAAPIIITLISCLGFANNYTDTVISINSLMQFLIVPANIFILQCVIVLQANKDKKLNIDVLRNPISK